MSVEGLCGVLGGYWWNGLAHVMIKPSPPSRTLPTESEAEKCGAGNPLVSHLHTWSFPMEGSQMRHIQRWQSDSNLPFLKAL